ncbi:hypothetical protein PROFUN_03799 [Planoprotostelium fungivorum]|uniref:Uncharacterized protein n=1 Tax=Planoprotostelium fungivorum TaxID=1890364 RepID=A0A2P6NI73_9EUKA|nr:hypothetical protein PROFUN_03799 [Planoprotostelium fungivorum]
MTKDELMMRFYQQQAEAEREEEDQRCAQMRVLQESIRLQDSLRNQAALQLQYLEQSAGRATPELHNPLMNSFPPAVHVPRSMQPQKMERQGDITDCRQLPSISFLTGNHPGDARPSYATSSDPIVPQNRRSHSRSNSTSSLDQTTMIAPPPRTEPPKKLPPPSLRDVPYERMSKSMPLLPVQIPEEKKPEAVAEAKLPFNLPSALNGFLRDQGTRLGISADSREASRLMQCIQTNHVTTSVPTGRTKEEEDREERRIVARALRKVKKNSPKKLPVDVDRINRLYGQQKKSEEEEHKENGSDDSDSSTHGSVLSIKSLINDRDVVPAKDFDMNLKAKSSDECPKQRQLNASFSNLQIVDLKGDKGEENQTKKGPVSSVRFSSKRGYRVSSPRMRRVRFASPEMNSSPLLANSKLSHLTENLNMSPQSSPVISPQTKRRRFVQVMEQRKRDRAVAIQTSQLVLQQQQQQGQVPTVTNHTSSTIVINGKRAEEKGQGLRQAGVLPPQQPLLEKLAAAAESQRRMAESAI